MRGEGGGERGEGGGERGEGEGGGETETCITHVLNYTHVELLIIIMLMQ